MSRTRWLRNNSYKYKFQIILFLIIILFLSSCGVIINDIIGETRTSKTVELKIIYQGFFYGPVPNFTFKDLQEVSIDSTSSLVYNGTTYSFTQGEAPLLVYSKDSGFFNSEIKPLNLIVEQQANVNLAVNLGVEVSYINVETGDSTQLSFDLTLSISTDTLNVNRLTFILGLDESGNLVYDVLKEDDCSVIEIAETENNIYYVTNNGIYYSTLKVDDSTPVIYYPTSWGKDILYFKYQE
ncbi:hypothetical protein [Thermosipho atlanticus]|uniref:Uncharacterized protein n=1 Tax=Thermosipho atlanticus DSM 15807 TaxID=1123380 RepID=A0A1M5R597_9BACT|nr:hypothetical protein [Thermosipho atlanticus]SHH21348.1 hypothetical protein SAMN02745199_0337 [Thermosipho atlanticus DSM 15807]